MAFNVIKAITRLRERIEALEATDPVPGPPGTPGLQGPRGFTGLTGLQGPPGTPADTSRLDAFDEWSEVADEDLRRAEDGLDELRARVAALEGEPEPEPGEGPFAGWTLLREDDCTNPDAAELWGRIAAVSPDRHELITTGPYRRMHVEDGDDFETNSGERAELGTNTQNPERTFMTFNEGERKGIEFTFRLGADWPLSSPRYQNVCQVKQAQPYDETPPGIGFHLEARDGALQLRSKTRGLFEVEVETERWYHVAIDATWSRDSGDFTFWLDGELLFAAPGLDLLMPGDGNPVPTGESIPSFITRGIYHDDSLPPCHIDLGPTRIWTP